MYQCRCKAKNSWWWAERLPEACRVVMSIRLECSASVDFVHRELVLHSWYRSKKRNYPHWRYCCLSEHGNYWLNDNATSKKTWIFISEYFCEECFFLLLLEFLNKMSVFSFRETVIFVVRLCSSWWEPQVVLITGLVAGEGFFTSWC